ncbi:hypothetical protein BW722_06735 [Lawsonia intracellularis]|nr:hypothetical protein BW722_06735 [Lawsonia intracellularis]
MYTYIHTINSKFFSIKKNYFRLITIIFILLFLCYYKNSYSGDIGKRDTYDEFNWCMKQLQSISTSLNNLIQYMYEAHIRVDTSDAILRMTESYIETFTIVQNDIFNMLINESSMVRRLLQTATNDIKNGIDVSKHIHSLNNLLSNTYKYEVKINQIKQNQQKYIHDRHNVITNLLALEESVTEKLQSTQQLILSMVMTIPQYVRIPYLLEAIQQRLSNAQHQIPQLEAALDDLKSKISSCAGGHIKNVELVQELQSNLEKALMLLLESENGLRSVILKGKDQGPKPPPPSGGASASMANFSLGEGSAAFVSGYDILGNVSSLQELQCIFGNAITQVSSILKMWSLRNTFCIHETKCNMPHFFHSDIFRKKEKKISDLSLPQLSLLSHLSAPYHMFSSVEGYYKNLEYKPHAIQAEVIVFPVTGLQLGVSYDFLENRMLKVRHNSFGSAKAKTTTNILSLAVSWNAEQTGLMGQAIGCYGWGYMPNTRYVPFVGEKISVNSKPDIELNGGLFQLGYNIQISSPIRLTPYVEGMLVTLGWKNYKEHYGVVSSNISNYKEALWERSVGLRGYWNINPQSNIQAWISKIFGRSNTTKLKATSLLFSIPVYKMTLPVLEKRFIKNELGMSYSMKLSDKMCMSLNSIFNYTNNTLHTQNIQCSFQYVY